MLSFAILVLINISQSSKLEIRKGAISSTEHLPHLISEHISTNIMGPSLNNHSSFVRPRTGDRDGRPGTRDQTDQNLIIPSRTSSLHSRITQPIPSTLNVKTQQRTPKTLTHAYMVCGVGREPSQWVKAPAPAQGKIGHMKGAVGQFWLPEILGSSPRLEQDNEIARALHAAMRVGLPRSWRYVQSLTPARLVFRTTLKSVQDAASRIVCTILSSFNKIPPIRSTGLRFESGQEQTRSARRPFATSEGGQSQTSTILRMRLTGFLTACPSFLDIPSTTCWVIISVGCGFTGTKLPTSSTPRRFLEFFLFPHRD